VLFLTAYSGFHKQGKHSENTQQRENAIKYTKWQLGFMLKIEMDRNWIPWFTNFTMNVINVIKNDIWFFSFRLSITIQAFSDTKAWRSFINDVTSLEKKV